MSIILENGLKVCINDLLLDISGTHPTLHLVKYIYLECHSLVLIIPLNARIKMNLGPSSHWQMRNYEKYHEAIANDNVIQNLINLLQFAYTQICQHSGNISYMNWFHSNQIYPYVTKTIH